MQTDTTTTTGATTTIKTSRRTKAEFQRQIEFWKVTAILAAIGKRTTENIYQDIALNGRFIPSQVEIDDLWREVHENRKGASSCGA